MLRTFIAFSLMTITTSATASSQSQLPPAPLVTRAENTIGIVDGRITVPALGQSFSVRALRKSSDDGFGRSIGVCAGRGEWKCVVGGAALGFVTGALIGHSVGPKPVEHHESGYGFFGYYSYMQCDAHCDDQDKYVMPVGIGGALVGGVVGHYVAKWSSR